MISSGVSAYNYIPSAVGVNSLGDSKQLWSKLIYDFEGVSSLYEGDEFSLFSEKGTLSSTLPVNNMAPLILKVSPFLYFLNFMYSPNLSIVFASN